MARVKRGTIHLKKRRGILKDAKGFKWGRKKLIRLASTAVTHAGAHAYKDRKRKKSDFRQLWQIRIGAAAKENGVSYSSLIGSLKKKNIELDRKILADLAVNHPKVFAAVVKESGAAAKPQKTEKKEEKAAVEA